MPAQDSARHSVRPPSTAAKQWVDDVLHFWFEELQPVDWFKGDEQLDQTIRMRFADLRQSLKQAPPSTNLDARTLLATVIVFDQFSRNLFRKSAEAYTTDQRALELARHAVSTGLDRALPRRQRYFLYMPFMHSEDRAMQRESVRLFTELGLEDGVKWSKHHASIVERFGRFPHRNAIFGRTSTPEEIEFPKTEPGFG